MNILLKYDRNLPTKKIIVKIIIKFLLWFERVNKIYMKIKIKI
jgi:hypothetical protein